MAVHNIIITCNDEKYAPPSEPVLSLEILDDEVVFLTVGDYHSAYADEGVKNSRTVGVRWDELVAARELLMAKRAPTVAERAHAEAQREADRLAQRVLAERSPDEEAADAGVPDRAINDGVEPHPSSDRERQPADLQA